MSPVESAEDLREAVRKGAEEAASRMSDAAETATDKAHQLGRNPGAKAAKGGARFGLFGTRTGVKAGRAGAKTGAKVGAAGAKTGAKVGAAGAKVGAKGALFGAKAGAREKLRPARDAKLKVQLAKTSRELSHEAADLGDAVDSLNQVIKANRRDGARSRTRLVVGIVVGAFVTYHADAERGAQRRAATARKLRGLAGSH